MKIEIEDQRFELKRDREFIALRISDGENETFQLLTYGEYKSLLRLFVYFGRKQGIVLEALKPGKYALTRSGRLTKPK